MFFKNYYGNALVNADHIVTLVITEPRGEQIDHTVTATLIHGMSIMCRGTKEACEQYLQNFAAIVAAEREARK